MGGDGKKKGVKLNAMENFVLSGSAAVISKTASAPIERVKLLIQNQVKCIFYFVFFFVFFFFLCFLNIKNPSHATKLNKNK